MRGRCHERREPFSQGIHQARSEKAQFFQTRSGLEVRRFCNNLRNVALGGRIRAHRRPSSPSGPQNCRSDLLLKRRIGPSRWEVSEGVVVHASASVGAPPAKRNPAGPPNRWGVEPQQNLDPRAWILAERVELLLNRELC